MRVQSIEIASGFKRFNGLSVGEIPESARLVVLLGSNGSGKSSFLEAMLFWHLHFGGRVRKRNMDDHYYRRPNQSEPVQLTVSFHGVQPSDAVARARTFHFRSAYRYTSDFQTRQVGHLTPIENANPIDGLFEEDHSVNDNYNRLVGKAVAAFANIQEETTNTAVYANDVAPLDESLHRLFPDLRLTSLGDPVSDGTFFFTKGAVEKFRYVNLSSGEKAAFDLLLDLHIRKSFYPESVICLDEPEAHLGVGIQGQILDEMLDILPSECQLWIATHSIGMMRRAFERALQAPSEVVFLDFDGRDYDQATTIAPSTPSRALWRKVHGLALEDLAALVAPDVVYICEGDPAAPTATKRSFDSAVLKAIFGDAYPSFDFVSVGGATAQPVLSHSVTALMPGVSVRRLIDRDSRTDQAIADMKLADPALRVLSLRDLENYLLSDEILQIGCMKYADNPESATKELLFEKEQLLAAQDHGDDVKAIAGQLFEAAKKLWRRLTRPGQDRHEFMRDVCAALVTSETLTYQSLRVDLGLDD